MEKKLMLPANYNVMNEEEMTYTSGGDGFTAPFAVVGTIGAVISVANLIWGLDQTRTWIKNNKKNGENITDLAAKGINAAADYMGKSIGNAIVGRLHRSEPDRLGGPLPRSPGSRPDRSDQTARRTPKNNTGRRLSPSGRAAAFFVHRLFLEISCRLGYTRAISKNHSFF